MSNVDFVPFAFCVVIVSLVHIRLFVSDCIFISLWFSFGCVVSCFWLFWGIFCLLCICCCSTLNEVTVDMDQNGAKSSPDLQKNNGGKYQFMVSVWSHIIHRGITLSFADGAPHSGSWFSTTCILAFTILLLDSDSQQTSFIENYKCGPIIKHFHFPNHFNTT